MVHPGRIGKLKIDRIEVVGAWLLNGEREVLLPRMEMSDDMKPGDELELFVFPNEKGELEATLKKPLLLLGEAALLRIKDSTPVGAFADLGIRADLHIPPGEQRMKALDGKHYVITMQYDEERGKLYGSTRLNNFFRFHTRGYKRGDSVEIITVEKEDFGMKVIMNQKCFAVLPWGETFRHVRIGETYKAYVRTVEPKQVIVSLKSEGLDEVESSADYILEYLEMNGGYARLTDDTDPREIELRLHMSKKTFKRAIGYLQKRGKLVITRRGIKLPKDNTNEKIQEEQ